MVNVNQMIRHIADLFKVDPSSAKLHGRRAREAGFLSQSGHGRGAADATPRDAAAMIISLVLCPWPGRAPEYIEDFGGLVYGSYDGGELFGKYAPKPTLIDAIEDIIRKFGDPEFARDVVRTADVSGSSDFPIRTFSRAEVRFDDSHLSGMVGFGDWQALYDHKSIADLRAEPALDTARADVAFKLHDAVRERYYRGFDSTKRIDEAALASIANLVNGTNWRTLLETAFLERGCGSGVIHE
jgi:hypothetical protein